MLVLQGLQTGCFRGQTIPGYFMHTGEHPTGQIVLRVRRGHLERWPLQRGKHRPPTSPLILGDESDPSFLRMAKWVAMLRVMTGPTEVYVCPKWWPRFSQPRKAPLSTSAQPHWPRKASSVSSPESGVGNAVRPRRRPEESALELVPGP